MSLALSCLSLCLSFSLSVSLPFLSYAAVFSPLPPRLRPDGLRQARGTHYKQRNTKAKPAESSSTAAPRPPTPPPVVGGGGGRVPPVSLICVSRNFCTFEQQVLRRPRLKPDLCQHFFPPGGNSSLTLKSSRWQKKWRKHFSVTTTAS